MVDKVFLKVSPWKKVLHFGHKGKLSPKHIGPYEIIERELDQLHINCKKSMMYSMNLCSNDIGLIHVMLYRLRQLKFNLISRMKKNR
ncbi:DNA/RNA polymerase superfamily protein [Gossypium australe]|uniref:DNA/RNA polymerase superfamily protein n=1 Tax=Gossypium australe TaxID=47621 RepID=A0A5B6V815_9ROSI|nr:DNA/RNA polymerase superfamily protein [Gossypium australe]